MGRATFFLACAGVLSCDAVLGLGDFSDRPAASSAGVSSGGAGTGGGSASGAAMATGSAGATSAGGAGGQGPSYAAAAVTGGQLHSCALLKDGRVVCWGNNDNGQLGDGTFTSSPVPVVVKNVTSASAVTAGAAHTCAIVGGGNVVCWGDNKNSQLGVGANDSSEPVVPTGLPSNIGGISAGQTHTCAFVTGGTAYCWGNNATGQLGTGVLGGATNVQQVKNLLVVQSVSAGASHSCATADPSTVYCWGDNSFKQTGSINSVDVEPYAVGFYNSAGPKESGTPVVSAADTSCNMRGPAPWCWGRNDVGQLGTGTAGPNAGLAVPTTLDNVAQVSGAGQQFCARLQTGTVDCWGANDVGQLGTGTTGASVPTPGPVMNLTSATDVGVAPSHSCAVVEPTPGAPAVYCWGDNGAGQLGTGDMQSSSVPVPVKYLP